MLAQVLGLTRACGFDSQKLRLVSIRVVHRYGLKIVTPLQLLLAEEVAFCFPKIFHFLVGSRLKVTVLQNGPEAFQVSTLLLAHTLHSLRFLSWVAWVFRAIFYC